MMVMLTLEDVFFTPHFPAFQAVSELVLEFMHS